MCTALMVPPTASDESVKVKAPTLLRDRAALIAERSSEMCAALIKVVLVTSGLSLKLLGLIAKVAVTERAALMVTLHAPVPVQLPLQPVNMEPDAGAALRLTA